MCFIAVCLFSSCKEEEFYEKEYIETLADKYEIDKQKIETTKLNCEQAELENKMLSRMVTINFPAAIECNFNEVGTLPSEMNEDLNGPRINGSIMARARQDFEIEVSGSETLCDMDFNFPNQQMQYDDEIILLLNDYVIISSQDYSESEKHPSGLYVNEWGLQEYVWYAPQNSLYNLHYGWNYTDRYCLGVSQDDPNYDEKCLIPKTETVGEMKLDISNEEIIKIGVLSLDPTPNANQYFNFSFVTTGDNDNGDCEHAAYSFDVELKYIQ